jgi:hypothetical protein
VQRLRRVALVALVAVLAVTGCGSGGQDRDAAPRPSAPAAPAAGSASPSGPGSAGPGSAGPTGSPTPAVPVEFSVDGAGPYQLGATLEQLRAAPGLDAITGGGPGPACAQNTNARGTSAWKDVHLSFHPDGLLYLAVNRSPTIPTPSGAWLGTPLAQLKTIYANVARAELVRGTRRAFLVTTLSGRGILFELDTTTAVSAMLAGDSAYLRASFQAGTGYC